MLFMMLEKVTAILSQHGPTLDIWPCSHVVVVRRKPESARPRPQKTPNFYNLITYALKSYIYMLMLSVFYYMYAKS